MVTPIASSFVPFVERIHQKEAAVSKIKEIFTHLKPGQTLQNATEYLHLLERLQRDTKKEFSILTKAPQTPEGVQTIQTFVEYSATLHRVQQFAQTVHAAFQSKAPWAGQLRFQDTPLHWAVRRHDHKLALQLREQMELEEDANWLTPLHEAVLQNDPKMVDLLQYPHFEKYPALRRQFQETLQEIRMQLNALKQVDPKTDSARAAYEGNLYELAKANQFDEPDQDGLKALHYAILGGHKEAVLELAKRTNLYSLTPQGHSFLDYAVASGNLQIYQLFAPLRFLFTLAKQSEFHNYLVASGIYEQHLLHTAKERDPLAKAGMDQSLFGWNVNAIWFTSQFFNQIPKLPLPLGKIAEWTTNTSVSLNHLIGSSQITNVLPFPWAKKAFQGCLMSYPLILIAAYPFPRVQAALHPLMQGGKYTYSLLRLWGAVKPVFDRVPAYHSAFTSRPRQVIEGLSIDLFNVGTQVAISALSIVPLLTPIPK